MSSISTTTEMHPTGFYSASNIRQTTLPSSSYLGQWQGGDGRIMQALDLSGLRQKPPSEEELSLRDQLQNALRQSKIAIELLALTADKADAFRYIVLRQKEQWDKADQRLAEVCKQLNQVKLELEVCKKKLMLHGQQAASFSPSVITKTNEGMSGKRQKIER